MKDSLFIGILAVLGQAYGNILREFLEGKPRDVRNICNAVSNWALVPHQSDCRKFYVCANYGPEEMSCPQNYYFDKEQNRCTSEVEEECQSSWPRHFQGNCHAFEFCRNGSTVREYCPDDYFFDKTLTVCRPIADTPHHKCSCILPNHSTVKNDDDCASYYICLNGQAVLKHCRSGHYFNSYLNACVLDMDGGCVDGPPSMSDEEEAVLEVCQRIRSRNNDDDDASVERLILQPDSKDCSKFYMCINERVLTKYCPKGFYYNREMHYCEEDFKGDVCAKIRIQAQKKQEQEEKETLQYKAEIINQNEKDRPPAKHVKVNMEEDAGNKKRVEEAKTLESTAAVDEEEMAEVEHFTDIDMELSLPGLKLPTKHHFDKLASKFLLL